LSFAKIQIGLNKQCGEACNIVTRAKIQGRGVLANDRVEDGDFIVVKNNANAIPGATFRTVDDARKTIDLFIETFRTLATRLEQS
jgi:hypothetical protein